MNFQRNTQMNQTTPQPPSPSPPRPHFLNQFPFPATIDVDQQLCYPLSTLSLNNNTDRRTFLPSSLDYEYGGVCSPISDERFISPLNAVNYNNSFYSGVGHPTSVTVDPHLHQHHQYPTFGASTSRFDFDQRSYLFAKEQQLFYKNNNYGGVSKKKQSNEYLSGMSLKELKGMIYCLAKDQNGCRILQAKFENPTKEEIEIVMCEVMGSVTDLMKDQFGNYIIQKLVSVCNDDQMTLIVRELTEKSIDIILVSMTPYGYVFICFNNVFFYMFMLIMFVLLFLNL